MTSKHKSASPKRRLKRVLFATVCAMGVLALDLMMLPTRSRAESTPQAKKPNILVIWGDDIGGLTKPQGSAR